jgi:hypothetical protein
MRRQQQLVFIVALTNFVVSRLFVVVNAAAGGQGAARLDALAQFAAAALGNAAAAGAVERLAMAAELAGPRLAAMKGDTLAVDLA